MGFFFLLVFGGGAGGAALILFSLLGPDSSAGEFKWFKFLGTVGVVCSAVLLFCAGFASAERDLPIAKMDSLSADRLYEVGESMTLNGKSVYAIRSLEGDSFNLYEFPFSLPEGAKYVILERDVNDKLAVRVCEMAPATAPAG